MSGIGLTLADDRTMAELIQPQAFLRRFLLRVLPRTLLIALLTPVAFVVVLRWLPVPTTAFMLANPIQPVHHHWVSAEHISANAALAVIASEDQKFPEHWGFDLEAMHDAYVANERAMQAASKPAHHKRTVRIRGASTISQQTIKNLFLWSGRSYFRKAVEAALTLEMELLWPKRRILEVYLNSAQFGPDVYGIDAAATTYFGKSAAQLTPQEAARLAAVLPNPVRYSVAHPSPYVIDRANEIELQMRNLGDDLVPSLRWPTPHSTK